MNLHRRLERAEAAAAALANDTPDPHEAAFRAYAQAKREQMSRLLETLPEWVVEWLAAAADRGEVPPDPPPQCDAGVSGEVRLWLELEQMAQGIAAEPRRYYGPAWVPEAVCRVYLEHPEPRSWGYECAGCGFNPPALCPPGGHVADYVFHFARCPLCGAEELRWNGAAG